MRSFVRAVASRLGILELARRARDTIDGLTWAHHNRKFLRRSGGDGLPIPPPRLRILTTASASVEWFLNSGQAAKDSIQELLRDQRISPHQVTRVLDFGCGCGRVVRHWADRSDGVHGCDYNADLVAWCRKHLPFAQFETNQLAPPLHQYGTHSFDLVYALSVFTHLPQPLQRQWVAEMARILRPSGYLIISTHGEACLAPLSKQERAEFHAGELVVSTENEPGTNRCGVYCSEHYVRRHFAPGFIVRTFVPSGARGNPPQDLMLLQSADQADIPPLRHGTERHGER